jgi:hypothetical protein
MCDGEEVIVATRERVPDAVQRPCGAPQSRDPHRQFAEKVGPGSAAHHFVLRSVRGTIDDSYFTNPTSLKYFITPGWISAAFGAAATVFAAVVSHACGSFLHSAASAPCSVRASR